MFFILPLIGQAAALAVANQLLGPKADQKMGSSIVKGALEKATSADKQGAVDVPVRAIAETMFPKSVDLWVFISKAVSNAKKESSGNILKDLGWLTKTSAKFVANVINAEAGVSSEPVNPKKLPNFLHSSERANKVINGIECDDKIMYEVFSLSQSAYRVLGITLLISSILIIACIIYFVTKYFSIRAARKAKKEIKSLNFTSNIPF